ncbi:MAG: hypothetical protein ABL898_03695 [Hyphomicrobiaceae bacterium]|nr:hypothetical protein [Hyphomicrobiaceae bacterium]
MWDVTFDVLLHAPCSVALFFLGSFLGWSIAGSTGAMIGAISGLGIGAWLDISSSRLAQMIRWPALIGVVILLAYAIFR